MESEELRRIDCGQGRETNHNVATDRSPVFVEATPKLEGKVGYKQTPRIRDHAGRIYTYTIEPEYHNHMHSIGWIG